ncbi:Exonuclease V chloroplastic [Zea mays]|uniref:Exonuclease V chloroplastic n=1 Tax=Zea mays TaxID=4577 RepID=A0A1D6LGT6_MAIZE|nr:Exonuclease V chloroplastic [Zea mays]
MALIDAALAAAAAGARPLLSAAARRAAVPLSRAACSATDGLAAGDIEDAPPRSRLARFRERRALAVTDITATEWCEKQMEFVLERGKPEKTAAMRVGSDRHAQLEQEVVERVDVAIRSAEELWAVKFMNFIVGTNQLLFEGITREIPVIGVVEGSWISGIIDEIQMATVGVSLQPMLVDTKTRSTRTVPSEAQKRNGRLQLMCYKYLWDNLIAEKFPADNFFSHFNLDPNYLLSDDVKGYELQEDHSLLEEYRFTYDARWFRDQIQDVLSFWTGSHEPKLVAEEEMWKCRFCKFVSSCPMNASMPRC